jgi:hypothetical protein
MLGNAISYDPLTAASVASGHYAHVVSILLFELLVIYSSSAFGLHHVHFARQQKDADLQHGKLDRSSGL